MQGKAARFSRSRIINGLYSIKKLVFFFGQCNARITHPNLLDLSTGRAQNFVDNDLTFISSHTYNQIGPARDIRDIIFCNLYFI